MESYNVKVINDIIYNENTNIVSIFKDFLIYDDSSEFLKRFYKKNESQSRFPKIFNFYQTQNKLLPTIYNLPEGTIKKRYIKKEQTKNEEKDTHFEKNKKKKISRNLFLEDNKILNSKFLEELNSPDLCIDHQTIESNNISKSNTNRINNSYLKGLNKNARKDENLMKEESSLNYLLYQIGESNSKILYSISDDTKFNLSIEKRNIEIISEIEKFRDEPIVEFNILKRNQMLKSSRKVIRPIITNKEELQIKPFLTNKVKLLPKNFQTNPGKVEGKINLNINQNIRSKDVVDMIIKSKKNNVNKIKVQNQNINQLEQKRKNIDPPLINSKEKNSINIVNSIPQIKNFSNFSKQRIVYSHKEVLHQNIQNPIKSKETRTKGKINLEKQKSQPDLKIKETMKQNDFFIKKNSQIQLKNSNSLPIKDQHLVGYNNNLHCRPVISINFPQNDFLQIYPITKKNTYSLLKFHSCKNIIYKTNNSKKNQINIPYPLHEEINDLKLNRIVIKRPTNTLEKQAIFTKYDNSKGLTNAINTPSNSNQKINLINNLYISNNFFGSTKRPSMPNTKKFSMF